MSLSKERKGEIAFIFLKQKIEEQGITLKPNEVRRSIVNKAKQLGISEAETAEFLIDIVTDIFNLSIKKANHFVK